MSAQINLYHPRFLKRRELLTLANVVLAAFLLYAVLAWSGWWAWQEANARREAATLAETQLKAAKDQVEAATKAAKLRQPSPQLISEVNGAEGLLRRRSEIARLLESGAIGDSKGFSEYLRGFARQAPEGLWLTEFTIGAGGSDLEIRGRVVNPAALPDYIRRLGTENVFKGRNFASLTMNRTDPLPTQPTDGARSAQATGQLTSRGMTALRPIDFVLMPKLAEAKGTKP